MSQIGRNVTDADKGILLGKRYLIHDRHPLFTAEFLDLLAGAGVKSVKLPPRSPNLNAHAERFVRSIKESCLERMILFGEESLRTAIGNFVAHYHTERNHQGLANRLINPEVDHFGNAGAIQRRQRLGGMLNTTTAPPRDSAELLPASKRERAQTRSESADNVESFAPTPRLHFVASRLDPQFSLKPTISRDAANILFPDLTGSWVIGSE
jgi:hypothetical protein